MERDGKGHACPFWGGCCAGAGGMGAQFTFKPISRCFRNTSFHLPEAQLNTVLQQEVTRHSMGTSGTRLTALWLWA